MTLPFTPQQFFGAFADYNESVWPLQFVLNAAGVAALALIFAGHRQSGPLVSGVLAALWVWMGVAYHFAIFSAINPAAWFFGALCLAGAGAFAWAGIVRNGLQFRFSKSARGVLGCAFIAYALLIYPVLSSLLGHGYPAAPSFGLPCPTTIFTIGVLATLQAPFPRTVLAAPVLWAAIGGQAALLLGVVEDFGLIAAGLAGLWLIFPPSIQRRHA